MSTAKRKGTRFESEVVGFLRSHGFPFAERRALRGARDCGDVAGVVGWALECKATRELDLAGAVDEALTEARNSGAPLAAAIVKRRRRPTSDAYVVMPLAQFARLVADEARGVHGVTTPEPTSERMLRVLDKFKSHMAEG